VAFEEQDNLGIGYLASSLMAENFDVRIVDFRLREEKILQFLLPIDPLLVGFSIIFQHHIQRFAEVIGRLRAGGLTCHFCSGGHYPSLRPEELLAFIPELDSVVLFEGEHTLLDLVRCLAERGEWRSIKGIAHREGGRVRVNPLRPLERDLDLFPPPARLPLREYAFGRKFATLLAGRGCVNHCSFCSIREFYSRPPGPVKRVRRPEMVVSEMELLYERKNCSIFMFQDDDFPVACDSGRLWATRFCDQLAKKRLHNKILWKINCRPDEVDSGLFSQMKAHGLFLVYLGIESGNDQGLRLMNKRFSPQANFAAVKLLNELEILYDYGFMLFDPESSFQSVEENLDFLVELCGDGSSPVTFCKMLPYAGTRIERMLKEEGRLRGGPASVDYDFNDPSLDDLYEWMAECFSDWIGERDGVLNLARWIRYHIAVFRRFFPVDERFMALERSVRSVIRDSNLFLIDTARSLSRHCRNKSVRRSPHRLEAVRETVTRRHHEYRDALSRLLDEIEDMAHQSGKRSWSARNGPG